MKKNRKFGRILRKVQKDYDSVVPTQLEELTIVPNLNWVKRGDFFVQYTQYQNNESFLSNTTSSTTTLTRT
jgi:hypothetical protein